MKRLRKEDELVNAEELPATLSECGLKMLARMREQVVNVSKRNTLLKRLRLFFGGQVGSSAKLIVYFLLGRRHNFCGRCNGSLYS